MSHAAQLPEPAAELLVVAGRVTAPWLRRAVGDAAAAHGIDAAAWDDLDATVGRTAAVVLTQLEMLLATDVDEQRTNPLSLYRDAVADVTELLRRHGVPTPAPDPFAAVHFPDDPYRIGPATWSDVDPDLHTPGLTWGAWKAMTVLQRRRDEGRR